MLEVVVFKMYMGREIFFLKCCSILRRTSFWCSLGGFSRDFFVNDFLAIQRLFL